MLQPSRAPQGDAPPAPVESQPSDAPAAAPPDGGFGGMGVILLPLLLMVGLMIFMSRSDRKRREKLESNLKKGDRVLTQAGFIVKLVEVGESEVKVELAPGVVVKMVKSAIQGHADAAAASAKVVTDAKAITAKESKAEAKASKK
jgi:preprotein translocase subunit YajC